MESSLFIMQDLSQTPLFLPPAFPHCVRPYTSFQGTSPLAFCMTEKHQKLNGNAILLSDNSKITLFHFVSLANIARRCATNVSRVICYRTFSHKTYLLNYMAIADKVCTNAYYYYISTTLS